ncbi:MAG TPA: M28 family peptidase [Myxococcota bacterium]|nr:M28 family peptidase [Myxococcota bacterium]
MEASARPEFDGVRAFRDLAALVQIGPRPAGSRGAALARELIRDRLRQAGWVVEAHEFSVARPHAPAVAMVNLIARRSASQPARTLVITHYDTKSIPNIAFLGANDGASGVAVLLELARILAADDPPPPVALVFFDGEESFGANIDQSDGLYGSKALAQRMAEDGSLAQVGALVLVDMVGDSDLNLARDLGSSAALRQKFEAASAQLQLPPPFDPDQEMSVIDDHTPFQDRGVRDVLVLLDFQYGARVSPGPRWHTAGDTLDAVSPDSLARVGKPLVVVLRGLGAGPQASP